MDEVVDVLFRPWRRDAPALVAGDRVLFLGARAHPDLALLAPATLVAVQPFRPWAAELEAAGVEVLRDDADVTGEFAAVLVLPPPQRDAALAWIARAVLRVRDGGEVVVCAPSKLGGNRAAGDLEALVGQVQQETKHRCRVAVARRTASFDRATAEAWAIGDDVRPVLDGAFLSRPGVFGWDQVDVGSALLAAHLPARLGERVIDAGCGFGWLAAQAVGRVGEVLHLLEADARALACAEANLGPRAGDVEVRPHWCDATGAWPVRFVDAVITNPPFHEGGRTDVGLGQAFLARAHDALRPGGRLWLVANRHLPYESVLRGRFGTYEVVVEKAGFKVLSAMRKRA